MSKSGLASLFKDSIHNADIVPLSVSVLRTLRDRINQEADERGIPRNALAVALLVEGLRQLDKLSADEPEK